MTLVGRRDLVATLRVALTLCALATLVAALVHLAVADDVRDILGFTFPGVPDRLGEVGTILFNNARILLAVVVASAVAQAAVEANADGLARGAMTSVVRFCDVALLLWCLVQATVVGAALGAYGVRALWSILAHLPFELAAFSFALALYLRARREPVRVLDLTAVAAVSVLLLAVGAFIEVYA